MLIRSQFIRRAEKYCSALKTPSVGRVRLSKGREKYKPIEKEMLFLASRFSIKRPI